MFVFHETQVTTNGIAMAALQCQGNKPGREAISLRQHGEGIVEVLVAMFILGVITTAFLGLSGAFMHGSLDARQRGAAVRCAQHVIEQIRARAGELPQPSSCGDPVFPQLAYELATGGDGDSMVTVSVYARSPGHDQLVYAVTTARSLGVSPP